MEPVGADAVVTTCCIRTAALPIYHVLHVLIVSAELEVVRIDARGIVAAMAYYHTLGDWAIVHGPH